MNFSATIDESTTSALATQIEPRDLLIDARRVPASSGQYFDTFDPATERPIARVAAGDAADIDAAVRSARAAFNGPWSQLRARDRGQLLLRFADRIREHADELIEL